MIILLAGMNGLAHLTIHTISILRSNSSKQLLLKWILNYLWLNWSLSLLKFFFIKLLPKIQLRFWWSELLLTTQSIAELINSRLQVIVSNNNITSPTLSIRLLIFLFIILKVRSWVLLVETQSSSCRNFLSKRKTLIERTI
jgi:hypothetical protein